MTFDFKNTTIPGHKPENNFSLRSQRKLVRGGGETIIINIFSTSSIFYHTENQHTTFKVQEMPVISGQVNSQPGIHHT